MFTKPRNFTEYEIEMMKDLLSPYNPSLERRESRKEAWKKLGFSAERERNYPLWSD